MVGLHVASLVGAGAASAARSPPRESIVMRPSVADGPGNWDSARACPCRVPGRSRNTGRAYAARSAACHAYLRTWLLRSASSAAQWRAAYCWHAWTVRNPSSDATCFSGRRFSNRVRIFVALSVSIGFAGRPTFSIDTRSDRPCQGVSIEKKRKIVLDADSPMRFGHKVPRFVTPLTKSVTFLLTVGAD